MGEKMSDETDMIMSIVYNWIGSERRVCPECGNSMPRGDSYCEPCREELLAGASSAECPEGMSCRMCGEDLPLSEDEYCDECHQEARDIQAEERFEMEREEGYRDDE
jgi:predicted amidophosphoribosyltransferase